MKHKRCAWASALILTLLLMSPAVARSGAAKPVALIHKALIVSVDGLRPDLLLQAHAPNIRALMRRGSYTVWARTVAEGYTVPSHVSMLTGVVPDRHGVTWDNHIEDAYPKVPTLFELAKNVGYSTAVVTGKTKLIVLTKPGTLDWKYIANENEEDDVAVARHATTLIRDHRPDVLFVHLGQVDVVGHASGWGSEPQMRAIVRADMAFGLVVRALDEAHLVDSTLVILTADHGGEGLAHRPEDVRSQFIPWIAAGPFVRSNFDLTQIDQLAVDTMSTFATVYDALNIDVSEPVDGRAVSQIFTAPRPQLATQDVSPP